MISLPTFTQASKPVTAGPGRSLKEMEREELRTQLQNHQGSRAELAARLGISERSLYPKLREFEKQAGM